MEDKNGWIKLYRKIKDNILWQDKPFSKGQAWIDILMEVNHKENELLLGNETIKVQPGEKITSVRLLCERWGWSNTKVKNFLDLLEKQRMATHKSDTKKTVIKVLKYSDYQRSENKENDTKTHQKHIKNTSKAYQKHTNKNVKNLKNDKECKEVSNIPYSEIVDYLNSVLDTNYRSSSAKTKSLIKARWNEGFGLDDFKTVIDKKVAEWLGNKKCEKWLRPYTLFSNKFENYLNQLSGDDLEDEEKMMEKYLEDDLVLTDKEREKLGLNKPRKNMWETEEE